MRRDRRATSALGAEHPTARAFFLAGLEEDLATLADGVLDGREIATIGGIVARRDGWLDAPRGHLAHGDLDLTHIYAHEGRYSGMIDFGEIRGADRWYDLGHFRLRDGERSRTPTLPPLLAGYGSVTPLPGDHEQRIAFATLRIAVRVLARRRRRFGVVPDGSPELAALRRAIGTLAGA